MLYFKTIKIVFDLSYSFISKCPETSDRIKLTKNHLILNGNLQLLAHSWHKPKI
jgi:hypothetical protein